MLKRLDEVLDAGYLPDMYIDYSIKYLLFKEDLSNEKLNYEYLKGLIYLCELLKLWSN